jgi:transcriptional regulator with XRE-family HTH domain
MTINGAQVREARNLLGWTVPGLAALSGIDPKHLDAFERGKRRMSVLDLSVIQTALARAGVEFIDVQPGVRLKGKDGH